MNEKKLQQYAELVVKQGIHVEKGEEVWITGGVENSKFIAKVVEESYKAGAKKVVVDWVCDATARLKYKYETVSELGKVPPYQLAKFKYAAKKLPSRLYIDDEDPDAFKGIDPTKMAKARMKSYPKIKPYRDAMDGKYKWCIAAVPSKAWAKKIFPDVNEEEAMEKLWEAIFYTCRVEESGTNDNWDKHNAYLIQKRDLLGSLNLKYLEYKSSTGTDFKIELIKGITWGAGIEKTNLGKTFNPNIPTEEVFTTPLQGTGDGLLVATKPLSYQGQLIEDFSIRFENGKAVEVKAKKGQQLLEHMIKMDENACKLGECALVPYSSPINQSGILFYNTLFDENAVCHVALGAGFKELLPDGPELTTEQAYERGINDSMIHVDFMIGSPDLSIVGIDENGKRIQLFKDGTWAI
ncbi:MAG: aminopeptidase [Erysipelotrichaceae bacterium]|nr:aminopeptidase [Erysipelotrichaceae bacterium]